MIYGIGTDLVEIDRIEDAHSEKFINRILTGHEIERYNGLKTEKRKIEYLAGRFAAKEAFVKALGTGIGEVSFQDIEILSSGGKPVCNYKDFKCYVTISHTDEYAVAFVVLEK